ncbi:MAG TPA: prepilin-type N-terminal cleavage/methylation domain-containing protein [Candidatus Ozemobacteraceae bacterium]|nr:prepilin-type N-terminal cleavage/methylation domain-containing protein [Candidatus Ozemobacteraceae bacterium]
MTINKHAGIYNMRYFNRRTIRNGFSLVELIIVVAVIAALVALATPYYSDYVAQSEVAVMKANLKAIRKALMEYRADKGEYPLTAKFGDLATTTPGRGYLMVIPADPMRDHAAISSWGYDYQTGWTKYKLDPAYDSYLNE